jgi:hypothetical protein
MFKSVYYSGRASIEDDDYQRVKAITDDSAFWTEVDDVYIRFGVQEVDDVGKPLPEMWISLELGEIHSKKDPLCWGGTLTEFKKLLTKINRTEEEDEDE